MNGLTETGELRQRIAELEAKLAEKAALAYLRRKRTIEADKLWQVAHNQPNLFPDLGELIGWLMGRADEARAIIDDHIEREAAVCPEDVPFDEYIPALESQLAETRAEIERLQEWEFCMITQAPYEAAGATWEQRHKQDQEAISEQAKLVEQMREALGAADDLIAEYAADYEHRDNVDEIREMISAALSAAERGSK